jgi:hypothetical protein
VCTIICCKYMRRTFIWNRLIWNRKKSQACHFSKPCHWVE